MVVENNVLPGQDFRVYIGSPVLSFIENYSITQDWN